MIIKTLKLRKQLISLEKPILMGILNVTPDSFYEGSRVAANKILQKAEQLLNEGASILDIGGYSTRPNAEDVSLSEEIKRTAPVVEQLRQEFPEAYLSIDTFRSEAARIAIEAGADMINDVSGGNLDSKMFETVAELGVHYVLMHMRGTPQTMQSLTQYDNFLLDVFTELEQKLNQLKNLGVEDVSIDVGFGFAKTIEQNFSLLKNLKLFEQLEKPLLVGLSRKSMIYKTLQTSPSEALNGTSTLNTIALQNGANILRIHDVREAKEVVELWNRVYSEL